ncbi:MAG TPA: 7-cyano-7-deazaguanine synthase [Vicinamibacterales bacterium]|nr:7-cyano-7-deazaguanine synthase [Vicinamibacterales bacterium]
MHSLVMLSGGLDSAVLAAEEARTYVVHPVYVAGGLAWEEGEQRVILELLSRPPFSCASRPVQPLTRLEFSMRDVYPHSHWAVTGTPPAYDTPDEDVYLHGRNIALLSKAAVYAASRKISRIVVAPLAGNPFPDATPQFFAALNTAFSLGLAAPIEIAAPFVTLHKEDVIKIGSELGVPFELTLSCMNPSGTTHCGLCSKCRERRDAFQVAGIKDPTTYANVSPR